MMVESFFDCDFLAFLYQSKKINFNPPTAKGSLGKIPEIHFFNYGEIRLESYPNLNSRSLLEKI